MIGIRREDKSKWEARAPLVPGDIRRLSAAGLKFQVQAAPLRRFREEEYRAAGAEVVEELSAPVVMGVKEIPVRCLERGKTYIFFSHVIKGQPYNMPMLRRIMELGCTLIDYEKIVDAQGRRLVFFGRFAGLAGMIDALWALGRRLEREGLPTPFVDVRRAFEYHDLAHAKAEIAKIGERIRRDGLPAQIQPLVCGFSGYGNVSQGAQDIYSLLPVREVKPGELAGLPADAHTCFKVVFREEDMVEPTAPGGRFELQDYYKHPEKYRSKFFAYVPHLTILVNCIYWEPKYPRLVTKEQLTALWSGKAEPHAGDTAAQQIGEPPRLRVIADISCDINGSTECTVKATEPGEPVYVWEPLTGEVRDGVAGDGPVVLAVDILPCELPVDASKYFGQQLSPFVAALANANYTGTLAESGLPPELTRATIVWRGELTEPYRYLAEKVKTSC